MGSNSPRVPSFGRRISSSDNRAKLMNDTVSNLTLRQTRLLAAVINTTRSMLELAIEQDWDAVAKLEVLRRADLTRCFEIPVSEDQGELLAEALAVLLHLNEEMAHLLSLAREEVIEESKEHSRQATAAEAYQRMQRVR